MTAKIGRTGHRSRIETRASPAARSRFTDYSPDSIRMFGNLDDRLPKTPWVVEASEKSTRDGSERA